MSDVTHQQTPTPRPRGPDAADPSRDLWSLWRRGQQPRVADFLERAGVRDPEQIAMALRVDQAERCRLGQWVPAEAYLDAFSAIRDDAEAAVDLIFAEYLLREERGEEPPLEEFLNRFPQHAGELKLQVELHRALEAAGDGARDDATLPVGSRPEPADRPAACPELPGYEVLGILGRGGMGVVYRAWQTELRRQVAVKMLHAGALAHPEMLSRFRREAEAVARLHHAGIVQIHGVGEHAGAPFLVLELVEGRSLAQALASTPQPAAWSARTMEKLARAIHSAHLSGVVHRDLSPANILMDADGTPKITDFGLAKLLIGGGSMRTQTGELLGTPSYMAPEQAGSLDGKIGPATDVYALGAILYEMLTGRPPFKAEQPMETMRQVLTEEPVSPSRLRPKLPRDLETICLKCLHKEPARRYATAEALADELRRFLEGRPIQTRRSTSAERAWRWCKRNPTVAALTGLAAALMVLIAIVSSVAAWTYYEQSNELRLEQRRTAAGRSRAERAEHDAQVALGQSLVSEGAAIQRTGLIGHRFDSLDRLALAARTLGADPEGRKRLPAIRNHAIAALGLTDIRVRREHDLGEVYDIGVDTALQRYAVMVRSGEMIVRGLDDDRELARFPGPDRRDFAFSYAEPLFSPDGELLAACYSRETSGNIFFRLRIWHLGRRELLGSLASRGARPAFHPDSRRLLFDAPGGGIDVWDRDERRVVRRLPLDFLPHELAIDPEGRRLAVNYDNAATPRVAILDLESGLVLKDWRSQVGDTAMAWSADGQLLAVGSNGTDPQVYVWNVRMGTLASVLQGHTGRIIDARFAHSGYLLATASWDGTTRLWDAASGEPLALAPGAFRVFSPDDRLLAYRMDGTISVRELATGEERRTLHPGMFGNRTESKRIARADVAASDFSPDGRLVATSDEDGVRFWEADTGRELAHLRAGLSDTVFFHPDGRSLITSGRWGLHRWPIDPDPDRGPDAIRIGPPELLRESASFKWTKAAWMPDHRTLALLDNPNARVRLVDSGHPHPAWSHAPALDSGENRRMTSVAVSPDGRWLAVGGWLERGMRIWDLRRRRLERILRPKELVGDQASHVVFSPDGRWLASCTSALGKVSYHFWNVGAWDLGRRIDQEQHGHVLFSPAFTGDGRLMAMAIAPDQVLLADAATGRELARLTTLEPLTPTPLAFSPDGTKLIARTNRRILLLWDLRRIRDQLGRLGLDWEAPPYPAAPESSDTTGPMPPPRPVRVVGEVIETQARRAAELAEMTRRLAADPADAEALVHRGWLFTLQKQWPEAIVDLEGRLRLRPDDPDACWLLAEAYRETGDATGALSAFSRLLERAEDHDARFWHGFLAQLLARPRVAADDFRRVLAVDPDRDPARYRRAKALTRLGRHREALADLEILIPKSPRDPALFDLRATVRDALGDREQARADREKAGSLLPNDSNALNEQAWILATGPIMQRDHERAVALARRAVALAPVEQVFLNTLGVALYRTGQDAEAIPILKRSLEAGKGEFDGFDLFFLAMAHHRLDHRAEARDCLDRAVNWLARQKNLNAGYAEELARFRAEAEALLAGPTDEMPEDVFAPSR
jgi:eukaryotic-like serine/threonine-protein kinase